MNNSNMNKPNISNTINLDKNTIDVKIIPNEEKLLLEIKFDKNKTSTNIEINNSIKVEYNIKELAGLFYRNPNTFMFFQVNYIIRECKAKISQTNIDWLFDNKELIRQAVMNKLFINGYISKFN